jgi:UDP:flavonoid glycosyltransferase YjiC (YdhE family)
VPFGALLPHVAAMVTNGGYGGVQFALSNGVPLVVAGTTEDKPEVAARVAWSGAGIDLKTAVPTPRRIAEAVGAVLADDRYRRNAARIRDDYARYRAPQRAADLIEKLAVSGAAVRRAATLKA